MKHLEAVSSPGAFQAWQGHEGGSQEYIDEWESWIDGPEGAAQFPVLQSVEAKAGRLTMFLSENAHSVSPVEHGNREAFFVWFSCTRDAMVTHVINQNRPG